MQKERSLRISADGRRLEYSDGRPFFYLADTAWELFHRLDRDEAARYLEDRARKGFTVIQAVVLAELDGLNAPTPAGHGPLIDNDPARPNEPYFADVDRVVEKAASLGMFVGMLPTWGDKWNKQWGVGPEIFTNEEKTFRYGQFLGQRYRDRPIIWILGGDRRIDTDRHRKIIAALARGLRDGDGGRHLITFHPVGQYSSAMWFHNERWLDFNMIQTGHTRERDNYNSVAAEYNRVPVKPVVDGEPGYENIPHAFDAANGRLDALQARKFCYWSLFSGACGHTYGCNDIWQMWKPGRDPMIAADTSWDKALGFPGSEQMGYARRLIESGPFFDRLPDQSLIASANATGPDHVRACRAPDARFALFYIPTGQPVTVRTFLLLAPRLSATWFDPRTGQNRPGEEAAVTSFGTHTYTPPGKEDWVLILRRP